MESHLFTNVLGLDLGTTNSVVTALRTGLPEVLKSKSGNTTPSCVMFNEDGSVTVGREAYEKRYLPNVVYSFKKYMGTDKKLLGGRSAREISSIFVKKLIEEVKQVNPQYINYNTILVSVPAYFDINQVEDTKQAIREAGFSVAGVEKEPISAAIVYQQIKRVNQNILVFDLGGGTFDAVMLSNNPGIPKESRELYEELGVTLPQHNAVLEVLDISGDNNLGGDDIDRIAVSKYLTANKMDATELEYQKLLLVAEKAKKMQYSPSIEGTDTIFDYEFVEEATRELFEKCMSIVEPMLKRTQQFNLHCVLCGGSTKSELLRNLLSERFACSYEIDPDLAVGVGNSLVQKFNNTEGSSIVRRLAKGVGVLAGNQIKFMAKKGDILPLNYSFQTRNSVPFDTKLNIQLYQGESAISNVTPVSTLVLDNITGHDQQGYVKVGLNLVITSDSTISVTVTTGNTSASAKLALTEKENEQRTDIHKDARFYDKFLKAANHYNDEELFDMVEQYKYSGDNELARAIMTKLSSLAG